MRDLFKRFFVLVGILSLGAFASAEDYIIKYSNQMNEYNQILSSVPDVKIVDDHKEAQLVQVKIPENQIDTALDRLRRDRRVEYVVKNFKLRAFSAPITASALRDQWAIEKVRAKEAWELGANKALSEVTLAVIDTGVDYNHESLAPNMVDGYDFIKNSADAMDITGFGNPGHGTHCAGIAGATGLIEGGVVGMHPHVKIMPIRFLDQNGGGDLLNGIKAIDFAIKNGAHVISASWGGSVPRSQALPLLEAIKRADDAGIIFVAAAANDGRNNDVVEVYPANSGYPNTISVGASSPNDSMPGWSNYGLGKVHLTAPGDSIMSTTPRNGYKILSGTSMATPLVAGLVSYLKAQDMSLTGAQIRALLQSTGYQTGSETACNCRVDAYEATQAVLNKKMTIVPSAATIEPTQSQKFEVLYGQPPYTFTSSDPNIAEVDSDGNLTAKVLGDITVSATDAAGNVATSLQIRIARPEVDNCPIGGPGVCKSVCAVLPFLPFCPAL